MEWWYQKRYRVVIVRYWCQCLMFHSEVILVAHPYSSLVLNKICVRTQMQVCYVFTNH